jgi:putative transposase
VSRTARKTSETGIYHVILRGINRQDIFEDDKDRARFLETIRNYKDLSKYEIYAYCLMTNHVHLLIKETEEPIGKSIKRICGSYVYWYNCRYERIGHLFQKRFKSEIIEDDKYFLTVLRYIHQNPVKAGLTKEVKGYRWSSYCDYIKGESLFTDINFALGMLAGERKKAIEQFEKFINEPNEDQCLDYGLNSSPRLLDNEVKQYLLINGISNISQLQQMEKDQRDEIIRAVKLMDGVTIRQLSRITGISKSVADRA